MTDAATRAGRSAPSGGREGILAALVPRLALAALAWLPYVASLRAPLLYDDRTLLDNSWLAREAGPRTVLGRDFWHGTRHEGSDLYRPLTVLTLAGNLRLAPSREGFRIVNVALHSGVTLLLAAFLRSLARRGGGSLPFSAWAGGALFAVHPLASESVLWTAGRAETLAAGFGFAAFLVWSSSGERPPGALRIAGVAALFGAALLSKESAACWLPIGALWRWLAPPRTRRARDLAVGLAAAAALAGFVLLRGSAVGWGTTEPPFLDNPLVRSGVAERVTSAVLLHGRYLLAMVAPHTLSVDHGYADTLPVAPLPWGAPAAAGLVLLWLALFVRLRARSREGAFLLAFVPSAFVVTGNLLHPIGTIFAERLAYLPLAGFCGLAGIGLAAVPRRAVRLALSVAILCLLGARTAARGAEYGSLVRLTEATAAASPRSVKALLNLGRVRLEVLRRPAEAIEPLRRAVELSPETERARLLLARAREEAGLAAVPEGAGRPAAEAPGEAGRAP